MLPSSNISGSDGVQMSGQSASECLEETGLVFPTGAAVVAETTVGTSR